jgi:hypothetical protein
MIQSETVRTDYAGSGGNLNSTYTPAFPVYRPEDVAVILFTEALGPRLLTLDADYTVTINLQTNVGTVTYPYTPENEDPLPNLGAGERLTLFPSHAFEQLTDFGTLSSYTPETHENAADYLTLLTLRLKDLQSRSIRAPDGDPLGVDMELPALASRASRVLAFNSAGEPVAVEVPSETNLETVGSGMIQPQAVQTLHLEDKLVTNIKLADVPTVTVKGRILSGTGAPTDVPVASLIDHLPLATSSKKGLMPQLPTNTLLFLQGNGEWADVKDLFPESLLREDVYLYASGATAYPVPPDDAKSVIVIAIGGGGGGGGLFAIDTVPGGHTWNPGTPYTGKNIVMAAHGGNAGNFAMFKLTAVQSWAASMELTVGGGGAGGPGSTNITVPGGSTKYRLLDKTSSTVAGVSGGSTLVKWTTSGGLKTLVAGGGNGGYGPHAALLITASNYFIASMMAAGAQNFVSDTSLLTIPTDATMTLYGKAKGPPGGCRRAGLAWDSTILAGANEGSVNPDTTLIGRATSFGGASPLTGVGVVAQSVETMNADTLALGSTSAATVASGAPATCPGGGGAGAAGRYSTSGGCPGGVGAGGLVILRWYSSL